MAHGGVLPYCPIEEKASVIVCVTLRALVVTIYVQCASQRIISWDMHMSTFADSHSFKPYTFVDILRYRAVHQPDRCAYTFLQGGGNELHLTYEELDCRSRGVAVMLQQMGLTGERALLLYPPGLEYIIAFFGCLYAGVIAVPVYPPRLNRNLARLQTIVVDAQPVAALTTTSLLADMSGLFAHMAELHWVATDRAPQDMPDRWLDITTDGDGRLAFLQYTSGSTATPKGVMLNHSNLLHNASRIQQCLEHKPADHAVIWLPPYHDMGLIGGILQPVYSGFSVTLLSPVAFLQRPLHWLETISRTHATTSGGPNFAYDLCAKNVTPEQLATLDLSGWDIAFNGAEPIRQDTLDRFAATFEPCGFRRAAFYPCYGLAEATLLVSGGKRAALPTARSFLASAIEEHHAVAIPASAKGARMLVGSGSPTSQEVAIVHPHLLTRCVPGEVGEIWVTGLSVAQGYWNRPEESAHTFHAYTSDTEEGPFLRTGDLGFLHDGEIFVAGRLKDLIIIRGRNHYPQDLEATVEQAHSALRPGYGAAFAIELNNEERVVVVQELDRRYRDPDIDAVLCSIRQAVADVHELQVYAVILIRHGSIQKTSSGKIQRQACRAAFLSNSLAVIAQSLLTSPITLSHAEENLMTREVLLSVAPADRQSLVESHLRTQAARFLNVSSDLLDPRQSLLTLGLDSLMAIEFKQHIEATIGVTVPIAMFFEDGTTARLATLILDQLAMPEVRSTAESGVMVGRIHDDEDVGPLSLGQQALWFIHQIAPHSAAYNIASGLRVQAAVDIPALERAFRTLIDRHASLRTTFTTRQGAPVQRIRDREEFGLDQWDASTWSEASIRCWLVDEAGRPFDLEQGPLLRVHVLSRSEREHILLLVMHHIIADFWSLELFKKELGLLYAARDTTTPASLPPLSLRYADYVRWQADVLASAEGEGLWAYWRDQLAGAPSMLNLPTTWPRPHHQTYRGALERLHVDEGLTGRLNDLSRAHGVTLYMVLLAAFQVLLSHYSGQDDILVGSPMAGRTRPEWAGIVGYFVNPVVLRADTSGDPTFTTFLTRVRQTVLDALEHQDYPFAVLVERLQPERDPGRSPLFQIMFIFQRERLLDPRSLTPFALGEGAAHMDLGGLPVESIDLDQQVAQFDLTLRMAEADGGLLMSLEYNSDLFDRPAVTQMLAHFRTLLEEVATGPGRPLPALLHAIPTQNRTIAVAATFTAEPVEASLAFWMEYLGMPSTVRFAPYNQIFQQLLEPSSLLRANSDGINLILLRLDNWLNPQEAQISEQRELERIVLDFLHALEAATSQTATPYLVVVCPPGDAARRDRQCNELMQRMAGLIVARMQALPGVSVLDGAELAIRYQVGESSDSFADQLGHVPFTPPFFAALGTSVARAIYAIRATPYKVVAVDCDQTLWAGVCGEDGAHGVEIQESHLVLQRFLVRQRDAGMLLCLCSKNNEDDVLDVFRQHPEMPLRVDHFVARCTNWRPKSGNIRTLSHELHLSLDSFILIDDDPVECAEVSAACPEVLTLSVPVGADRVRTFLDHVWAFDRVRLTEEDRQRAWLYEQNQRREQFRAEAPTLEDFLADLHLIVSITPVERPQLARVAQLTQRTNQFNTTTIRRTESELLQFIAAKTTQCWVVEVSDRFGDYGLVGVVIVDIASDTLEVDTFLLSCRVLGRRVEDIVLAKLGEVARERGCATISLRYRRTEKNRPVLDFFRRIAASGLPLQADSFTLTLPVNASVAASDPSHSTAHDANNAPPATDAPTADSSPIAGVQGTMSLPSKSDLLRHIAAQYQTADRILDAVYARKHAGVVVRRAYVAPRTAVEEVLADLWARALGLDAVGVDDDFFKLGGHSLLAVQVMSQLHDIFQVDGSLLGNFFDVPTVSGLANAMVQIQPEAEKIARVVKKLAYLSDEEVDALLGAKEMEAPHA